MFKGDRAKVSGKAMCAESATPICMLSFACDSFATASDTIMARVRWQINSIRPAIDKACIRWTTTNSRRRSEGGVRPT